MKPTILSIMYFVSTLTTPQSAWSGGAAIPATGDQHRTYVFAQTGETLPYRLFVPPAYRGEKDYPMVVVLHGGGANENRPMDNTGLEDEAVKRGYIVLSPLGYSRFGGYGNIYPVVVTPKTAASGVDFAAIARAEGPGRPSASAEQSVRPAATAGPAAAEDEYLEQPASVLSDGHISELSERETLAAIADVRGQYRIDRRRIYLMGNSAGGVGTLYLAAKYPNMWAAIAPQGGVIAAWSYPYWRLRDARLPVLVVHGDHDEHCNAKWSRAMVDRARLDGADAAFLLVKGGTHVSAWTQVLPQIFNFFDAHISVRSPADVGAD
jgi:poly(3-hydroxybutyrate) depolymerase